MSTTSTSVASLLFGMISNRNSAAGLNNTQQSRAKIMPFKSNVMPKQQKPPQCITSSQSANNVVTAPVASSSVAVVKTTHPKMKKDDSSTTKRQPATASAAVESRTFCPAKKKKKQPAVAQIEPGGAKKRATKPWILDDVPAVVSSTMTESQLMVEMKARGGNPYCANGMPKCLLFGQNTKEFLLSRLGTGTRVRSSIVQQDIQAQHLHMYQSTTKRYPTTAVLPPGRAVQSRTTLSPAKKKKTKQEAVAQIEPGGAKKRVKLGKILDIKPVAVSSSMTVMQLMNEMKARNPQSANDMTNGMQSYKQHREFLLSRLGIGTKLLSSAVQQDIQSQQLHIYQSHCHFHPLADSSILRDGERIHVNGGRCDVVCDSLICKKTPFRSCERCNWDICKPCFDIASLGSNQDRQIESRLGLYKMVAQRAKAQQEAERQEAEELYKRERTRWGQQDKRDPILRHLEDMYDWDDDESEEFDEQLEKFPSNIRNPSDAHIDDDNKMRYTVWTRVNLKETDGDDEYREFDSSFATKKEANLRVEYVFHYGTHLGGNGHVAEDMKLSGGLRFIKSKLDDDERNSFFTVSVLPSKVFDILQPDNSRKKQKQTKRAAIRKEITMYSNHIRNPGAANQEERKKLRFTVWTCWDPHDPFLEKDFYDDDGWDCRGSHPDKDFNSSYDTVEEANERAEYVFYHEFPWGEEYYRMNIDDEEVEAPQAKIDFVSSKTGLRRIECCPNNESDHQWIVSVVPSIAFDYIDI